MTLTEQWKNGELPDGFYYFKMPDGAIEIASEYRLILYNLTKDADKIEVLAPVPSYEEWQQLHKFLEEFNALDVAEENEALKTKLSIQCEANEELRKENQQLKELLKECRETIEDAWMYCGIATPDAEAILTKIDNAIGEKK